MKNRRILLFSVLLGTTAVLLMAVYISNIESNFRGKYEEIKILVAAKDIMRFERIDESMLEIRRIPKPFVQPLAVTDKEVNQIVGYNMADSTIKKGEQILKTKLALIGEGGISPIIPPGYRACTISVNEITGVAGLIRNSDSVDIIGTFKTLDRKTRAANSVEAITLFQNVPVLAVGRNYVIDRPTSDIPQKKGIFSAVADRGSFSNITLQVTHKECMDLAVAQQTGELTLSLRSYHDRFTAQEDKEMKKMRSTTESVTGIKELVQILKQPQWLEMRGEQSMFVP